MVFKPPRRAKYQEKSIINAKINQNYGFLIDHPNRGKV